MADLLEDLHNEGSLEKRLQIQKALADSGVDYLGLIKQAQREGMRPVDRLVSEALESGSENPQNT